MVVWLRQIAERTERQQDRLQLEAVKLMEQRDRHRMRLEVVSRKMEEEIRFRWERRMLQGRLQEMAQLGAAHQRQAAMWKSDTQQ